MSLINKILLESEEDDLFQPRRMEERVEEFKSTVKKMIKNFPIGTEIRVLMNGFSKHAKFAKAQTTDTVYYGSGEWLVQCKFQSGIGHYSGMFTIVAYNEKENYWVY